MILALATKVPYVGLVIAGVIFVKNVTLNGAKDIPKSTGKPSPAPTNQPPLASSNQIVKGLSGAAASVCTLAIKKLMNKFSAF